MNVQGNAWENQYGKDALALVVDTYANTKAVIDTLTEQQKARRGAILKAFEERGIKQYASRDHIATLRPVKGVVEDAVEILAGELSPQDLERVTARSTTIELLKKAVKKGIISQAMADSVINEAKTERLEVE